MKSAVGPAPLLTPPLAISALLVSVGGLFSPKQSSRSWSPFGGKAGAYMVEETTKEN